MEDVSREKNLFFSKFNELMEYTDLLLVDIKEINNERHQLLTGRSNENILDMARYLSELINQFGLDMFLFLKEVTMMKI